MNWENLTPERPTGVNWADSWWRKAIKEARMQLLDPGCVHYLCRDITLIDLEINELKAAILCAPMWMTSINGEFADDEVIAVHFARTLIAGKSGARGLPQEREALAPVATEEG